MKRALITGISGFVGRHLWKQLLCEEWEVYGFDRHAEGKNVFVGDLSDATALRWALSESKPDAVFHLAGVIKSDVAEAYYQSNLFGTLSLLRAIMQMEMLPRLILTSSSAVYGLTAGARPITERSPLRPLTEYAVSKVAQEIAALRYHYAFGLPVIIVRMFNLVGPGQSPELACSAFARQIALAEKTEQTEIVTGNLDARRDFIDVRDAARGLALLAEKGKAGQIYNICSGRAVTMQQCLRLLMSMSRKPLSVRKDVTRFQQNDVTIQVGSFQKIRQATGWRPRISLKQSLSDLLDDWRERVGAE